MQVQEYYANKVGGIPASKATAQGEQTGGGASFLSALKNCAQPLAGQATEQTKTLGAATASTQQAWMATARINVVPEDEMLLSTMSPEALQKQKELLERLDKLCADYPGAYYRLNPEIFEKMVDDPAFEEKIYKAVEDFEAANKKMAENPATGDRICSMRVDEDGDYVLMQSIWEQREEAEEAMWEVIFSNAAKRRKYSAEELRELFPGLTEEMANIASASLEMHEEAVEAVAAKEEAASTGAA